MSQQIDIDLETLVGVARTVEAQDPIDWGMLSVDEETAYRMIGTSIIEMYNTEWKNLEDKQLMYVALSTIIKLVVENMVLNIKLLSKD